GTAITVGAAGTIASTTVYVRLAATAPVGSYNSQNIVLSSTGATAVNVTTAASGNSVSAPSPVITLADTLGAVNTTYGTASATPTSFHVAGSALTGNLTVTPPAGYEVSLSSGTGYTTSLTITASGTLASTQVYARLAATAGVASSPYAGNITVSGGGASSQTIATASSTVAKVTPVVVVTPYTVTYDGNPHTATVTSITGVNGETAATVGSVTLTTTHTIAGTYATDSWSFTGTANYNNIGSTTLTNTINKAASSVTVTGTLSFTYSGSAQGPSTASVTGSTGAVTYSYVGTGGTIYSASATKPTNAGNYTVTATVAADSNFNTASSTATAFSINKATPTVVVAPYTVSYDGNPHTATVTSITGVSGQTGATVGTVTLNTTHTIAGTYATDSWSLTGTANYNNIASTTLTNTINKATPTATLAVSNSPVTYDSTAKTATVSITTSSVPGAVQNVLTGGTATQTAAGTYAVSADFMPTDAANYNALTGLSAGNFVITAGSGTTYASWAAANGVTGGVSGSSGNGGVQNGIAYFMGVTGPATNPALDAGRKVTWPNGGNIPSSAYGTQFVVQTSPDLVTWTPVAGTDSKLSNTAGSVSYTLAPGAGMTFVRLVVTPN
ncbi:MAG: hypothetical protein WCP35_10025, partial [Verrucomicrobiota bacterium]